VSLAQKYNNLATEQGQSKANESTDVSDELLNLTVEHPDLKAGVTSLARLLNLPEHHDHYVLLQVSFN